MNNEPIIKKRNGDLSSFTVPLLRYSFDQKLLNCELGRWRQCLVRNSVAYMNRDLVLAGRELRCVEELGERQALACVAHALPVLWNPSDLAPVPGEDVLHVHRWLERRLVNLRVVDLHVQPKRLAFLEDARNVRNDLELAYDELAYGHLILKSLKPRGKH